MCKPVGKPHKHAAVIIAWASGHAIQIKNSCGQWVAHDKPTWEYFDEYRIKPKEDTVVYAHVQRRGTHSAEVYITCEHNWNVAGKPCFTDPCNVKFTFDGETNELKQTEVIKP